MDTIKEIQNLLEKVCNKPVSINLNTNLDEEKILDSLDSMVFFMQFEEKFNVKIPEEIDLKENGYYLVSNLVNMIENK